MTEPLTKKELDSFADLYVSADESMNFYEEGGCIHQSCEIMGLVPIFDAEGDFVCMAYPDKVSMLARIINTYRPSDV